MNGEKCFNELLQRYYQEHTTYSNEIDIFKKYLYDNALQNTALHLAKEYIDEYFVYNVENRMGVRQTIVKQLSALKELFDFLSEDYDYFESLRGYISAPKYIAKLTKLVKKSLGKRPIPGDLDLAPQN